LFQSFTRAVHTLQNSEKTTKEEWCSKEWHGSSK
jgi:hypothetical protein